jgi:hypothetical protein
MQLVSIAFLNKPQAFVENGVVVYAGKASNKIVFL